MKAPKKGIALVLGMPDEHDEHEAGESKEYERAEEEGAHEAELEALDAFENGKTEEERLEGLRSLIKLCIPGEYEK